MEAGEASWAEGSLLRRECRLWYVDLFKWSHATGSEVNSRVSADTGHGRPTPIRQASPNPKRRVTISHAPELLLLLSSRVRAHCHSLHRLIRFVDIVRVGRPQ